jgi:hypothetical protein
LKKQENLGFSKFNSYIDPNVDRYKGMEEEQEEFKSNITKFVRAYSFISKAETKYETGSLSDLIEKLNECFGTDFAEMNKVL